MKRLFIIPLAIFAFRCDLFDTRNPEDPGSSKSNFHPAVSAQQLAENLMFSFHDKNKQNYIACFSDTTFTGRKFVFSPSSGAISQFPELAQDWNLEDEGAYFDNAVSKLKEGNLITLVLDNISSTTPTDSIIYSGSYELTLPNDDPNLPDEYRGNFTFNMITDRQGVTWYIHYWQDIKITGFPSWSELKGRLH